MLFYYSLVKNVAHYWYSVVKTKVHLPKISNYFDLIYSLFIVYVSLILFLTHSPKLKMTWTVFFVYDILNIEH